MSMLRSSGTLVIGLMLGGMVHAETKEFDAKNLKTLELGNPSGDTKISGKTGLQKATLRTSETKWSKDCVLVAELKDTTLKIQVKNKENSDESCEMDFNLELPSNVVADLKAGSGNFDISGLNSSVQMKLGSGDAEVRDVELTNLESNLGSGDLEFSGKTATLDVRSGSGDIKAEFKNIPQTVELRSGSGDISVQLPQNAKLKTSLSSGSGSISNKFANQNDAKATLNARSGSGDINIR